MTVNTLGYPYLQCTYWCAVRANWCIRYGNLGNALGWATNWAKDGGAVGHTPIVGAIACFQPGVDYAGNFGHVAVVEEVAADGLSFRVSEMDFPVGAGLRETRWAKMQPAPGLRFLYESAAEEDPMPNQAAWARALARSTFVSVLHRIPDEATLENLTNIGLTNPDAMVKQITESVEGKADEAKDLARDK